jgi:hypothetical protein
MIKFKNIRVWFNQQEAKLKILRDRVAGVKRAAEAVAEEARILAPVDTGELRDSIHVVSDADGMAHYVVAPVEHAEPVEFGHINVLTGRWVPPVMFLRKALRIVAARMAEYVGDTSIKQGFHHGRLMGGEFRV